ncbi:phage tail assembly chaperone [Sphingorhabdus sp. IMCC26285]|uniref:Phage tail assembly chaperone n=1 Tax=Sphingorhabdus profundilacus TaxID=2509718 RepID=A0A6I4LXM3_9SPHN|nr:phage tail assembly chaperone [Sphingorhabdus profundilacus]MVZ97781.1 phage tail assembly chaperone [Sphingorhabdus profundilacus]
MSFSHNALQIFAQCVWILGWRPHDFWDATPGELASIFSVGAAFTETPPDSAALHTLMELFPDG